MGKLLSLGTRLRYPITIVKRLKAPGDDIAKQEPAMQYSFKWMKEVGDPIRGETWQEEQVTVADWDSPVDGKVTEWRIREGMTIHRDTACILVEEPCTHEIQFAGMCAICGKDMTVVDWSSEQTDAQRAPINMTHDQTSLMVAQNVAERTEFQAQRRLVVGRKLSLVVDLDQTIIHACIEPTIGEWQGDSTNPNHEAVKEVRSFQLNDDGPRGLASGCWYYIKMRPGLAQFLERISELYELHVYTMGTRAYALNIAKIVDPQQKLFGNRVISRDENGSMISKSLQRLFPVSTDMVVIIDDRADVWPRNRQNLIKVVPYDFFKGIGDINSSFLPKRQDILPAPVAIQPNGTPPAPPTSTPSPAPSEVADVVPNGSKPSALEEFVSMSSGDDKELQRIQAQEQERSLEKQITDRPLLHMQEELDREDDQEIPENDHHDRQRILRDDDDELIHLQNHLTDLHGAFYKLYDQNTGGRIHYKIKEDKDGEEEPKVDLRLVPDVGQVLDRLKAAVLRGTVIVLSGLVPLGVDVLQSELGLQTTGFGAVIHTKVSRKVTHLVISTSRPRTQKVRQAARLSHIKIVNQNWLADCLSQWRHLDETPYLVEVHPADRLNLIASNDTTDAETASDVDSEMRRSRPHLTIVDEAGEERELEDNEDDESDDGGGEEEVEEGLLPDYSADGQTSPIDSLKTFDWGGVDDELAEFLGSDVEDDEEFHDRDDESTADNSEADDTDEADADVDERSRKTSPSNTQAGRKRKVTEDGGDDGPGNAESALAKKQKVARSRGGSSLRSVHTPNGEQTGADDVDGNGSLPTPQITGDEDDVIALVPNQNEDGLADDLEADLMAELEAEENG